MIEVHPGLFVGTDADVAEAKAKDFYIIHAAKEPWHRQALGYVERAAPKDHRDYLTAFRGRELMLNLIDTPDPAYIPDALVEVAMKNITANLAADNTMLIHCNLGRSRSPGLALLWLHLHAEDYAGLDYEAAAEKFTKVYPDYNPGAGIEGYLKAHWGLSDTP